MPIYSIFLNPLQQLSTQMAAFLPKIIAAVLIWLIGKYLLELAVRLIRKVNIKGTKLDEKVVNFLIKIAMPVGKVLLVLIVLDYLGIGRTVIGAFLNGLTLAIAIALGIAFGKALETDAGGLVGEAKKQLKK